MRVPKAAVEMAAPAMKLTLIIESTQDPAFIPRLIPLLTEMPLGEVLAQPFVASLLPPLLERHQEGIELIRNRSEEMRWNDLLRHHGSPGRGIQQVHPVLSASQGDVLDRAFEVQLPHEGVGGFESVDQG